MATEGTKLTKQPEFKVVPWTEELAFAALHVDPGASRILKQKAIVAALGEEGTTLPDEAFAVLEQAGWNLDKLALEATRFNPFHFGKGSKGGQFAPRAFPKASTLKRIKLAGGTTGAELAEDGNGNRYIVKRRGGPKGQRLREEATADAMYRAGGIAVPPSELQNEGGMLTKVSRFVPGQTLEQLDRDGKHDQAEVARRQVAKGFWLDALLANWDVIGLEDDNILVDQSGKAMRVDNGGSLRYRAMGKPKGKAFGSKVGELESMRGKTQRIDDSAYAVFGKLTDGEVAQQIEANLTSEMEDRLLAVPEMIDSDLRETMRARIDYMRRWAEDHAIME